MSDPNVANLLNQAEIARLQAEVARAQAEAAEAKVRVAQAELARLELVQKQQSAAAPTSSSPSKGTSNGDPTNSNPSHGSSTAPGNAPIAGPASPAQPHETSQDNGSGENGSSDKKNERDGQTQGKKFVTPAKEQLATKDQKETKRPSETRTQPVAKEGKQEGKPGRDVLRESSAAKAPKLPVAKPLPPAATPAAPLAKVAPPPAIAEEASPIEPPAPENPAEVIQMTVSGASKFASDITIEESRTVEGQSPLLLLADVPAIPLEPRVQGEQKEKTAEFSGLIAEVVKGPQGSSEGPALEASAPRPGSISSVLPPAAFEAISAPPAETVEPTVALKAARTPESPLPTAKSAPAKDEATLPAVSKAKPPEPTPRQKTAESRAAANASNPPTPRDKESGDKDRADKESGDTNTAEVRVPAGRLSPVFRLMGSSLTSVIVHMVVLIVLALMGPVAHLTNEIAPLLLADLPPPSEEITQILDRQIEASVNPVVGRAVGGGGTGVGGSVAAGAGHAGALGAGGGGGGPSLDRSANDGLGTSIKVGGVIGLGGVRGGTLDVEVSEMAPGDPQAVVDTMDEAMDRITMEVLQMLQKNKVLVVWLFDESLSMKDDQQEISIKIDRVYKELGLVGATKGDALMTAVASYGSQTHIISPEPTYDIDKIRNYIAAVPVEESGEEMQCYAIGRAVNQFKDFASRGRRQMVVIMITDESGDQKTNINLLEATIAELKSARSRIYVMGRESVFGYPYAFMNWTDPKTTINYWLQIDRGPETAWVEELQTDGLWWRRDAHASGFGPWEQARLARETGGVFFMLPSPEVRLVGRDDRKYALARLRPYMPDYESRKEYEAEREASPLRKKMWELINILNPHDPKVQPHIIMPHHFNIKPVEFVQDARAAIAKTQRYGEFLEQVEKELELLRPLREKEIYPRWQANYDLIYAQVLAYKVRLFEYKAYLEYVLKNPEVLKPSIKPPSPRTTYTDWAINYRQETITGDLTKSYIQRSRDLFQKVIDDHHGTPWASHAQDELNRGFGIHLVQRWDDPRRGQGVTLPKL